MSDPLHDSHEILKDTAAGVVKNAANPWWVIGFLLIGLCTFFCVGAIIVTVYGAKPLLDAQLESVRASTDAIKSNAETNRKTAEAITEIKAIVDKQERNTQSVLSNQDHIKNKAEQLLLDHQKIMGTLQQCLPQKPGG